VDLIEMHAARRWRRSRDLETVAMAVFLLRAVLVDKPSAEELLETFGDYEADS